MTRKPSKPWTLDEHNAFLDGLAVLGKGRWKDLSRMYVPSRTPTQVASHAQKYHERANRKPRKPRRSIFDVRLEGSDETPCVTPPDASDGEEPEPPRRHVVYKPKPMRPPAPSATALASAIPQFGDISPLLLYHYHVATRNRGVHRPIPRYPLSPSLAARRSL